MGSFVNAVCAKCTLHFTRIDSIQPDLSTEACHSAVVSQVVSTLDYCNALLAAQLTHRISRLQKLQKCSARLVSWRQSIHIIITPVLKELHWLHVRHCIALKIVIHTYKIMCPFVCIRVPDPGSSPDKYT